MPAVVASKVPSVYFVVGVWMVGGLIALIGALCFAELTTTYPDRGGDYGYLKRGYHPRIGFAFSWAAFWVIRPGNIGAMAMIFGEFAVKVFPDSVSQLVCSVACVIVISGLNLLGITFGKTTQNILTVAKVLGILCIIAAAFFLHVKTDPSLAADGATAVVAELDASAAAVTVSAEDSQAVAGTADNKTKSIVEIWSSFWLAMVFVMFTFGGWNDIAFVASEVKEPKRNLLRALVMGTLTVLGIYLMVNFALLYGLGFDTMSSLGAKWANPTSALIEQRMGSLGNSLFAALVCVSCLGGINAMIFTSPRIYWATAIDYPSLSWLTGSRGSDNNGWWRAMLLQMIVTLVFILTFTSKKGIEQITAATAPYFWLFLSLTVITLIVNRIKFKGQFEGYRVPLYPLTPILFVMACAFMIYQSWTFMISEGYWIQTMIIGIWVVAGLALSFAMRSKS